MERILKINPQPTNLLNRGWQFICHPSQNICILIGYSVIQYSWIHLLTRVYQVHALSGIATGQPENFSRIHKQLSLNASNPPWRSPPTHSMSPKNLLDIPPGEYNNMYIFYWRRTCSVFYQSCPLCEHSLGRYKQSEEEEKPLVI